jgi:hypothetical protein
MKSGQSGRTKIVQNVVTLLCRALLIRTSDMSVETSRYFSAGVKATMAGRTHARHRARLAADCAAGDLDDRVPRFVDARVGSGFVADVVLALPAELSSRGLHTGVRLNQQSGMPRW